MVTLKQRLRLFPFCVLSLLTLLGSKSLLAQQDSLEQRQPLELVFADSIVPQDRHEMMSTTGIWYFRNGISRNASVTQKIEWGISDQLQISTFVHLMNRSNQAGAMQSGFGDFEIGARYSWPKVGFEFTHIAIALDAGFPTGNSQRGLGEGNYSVSPSVLFSCEPGQGKYQLFNTTGAEFITAHRRLAPFQDDPRSSIFSNSGISLHAGRGWLVGEVAVSSNRVNGGNETQLSLTPSYIRRIARRTELLIGVPVGLTSSTDRIGGVIKFTFELGGGDK
ncbi:MAG TPA: hypothetical protein VFC63_10160 [Blastocatellia bacterium]|nr:hypothetical protein [Blastocatellia bacterium]